MSAPVIRLDPETHIYTVDGTPTISVSETLRLGGIAVDYAGVAPGVLAWARERGSHVDVCCQLLDAGVLDWSSVADEAVPYVEAWAKFTNDQGLREGWPQPIGYHPELGYCGTPDVIYSAPWILFVDRKCTYDVAPSYGVQVAAYSMPGMQYQYEVLDAVVPDRTAIRRAVVQLQKTGKYKLYTDAPADTAGRKVFDPSDYDAFKAALTIAQWKRLGTRRGNLKTKASSSDGTRLESRHAPEPGAPG
jgi:hypothetical protein